MGKLPIFPSGSSNWAKTLLPWKFRPNRSKIAKTHPKSGLGFWNRCPLWTIFGFFRPVSNFEQCAQTIVDIISKSRSSVYHPVKVTLLVQGPRHKPQAHLAIHSTATWLNTGESWMWMYYERACLLQQAKQDWKKGPLYMLYYTDVFLVVKQLR